MFSGVFSNVIGLLCYGLLVVLMLLPVIAAAALLCCLVCCHALPVVLSCYLLRCGVMLHNTCCVEGRNHVGEVGEVKTFVVMADMMVS